MTAARSEPALLDCGHPDTTPDTWHTTPNGHTVCHDCCPECNERPA
jgi:hypothetical protein